MNLPQLTASDVQLVSDETVCAAALRTYASAVPADSGTTYASVYVVRLGNYYLVTEPTQKAGEWLRAIVVNTVYTKTAGVFGF